MPTRWDLKDAVLASKLAPIPRLVMLVLVLRADTETGQIPPEFSPSMTTIAREAGVSRSTAAETLRALEHAGWIGRIAPPKADQLRRARNVYVLDVGDMAASGAHRRPTRSQHDPEPPPPETGSRSQHDLVTRSQDDLDQVAVRPSQQPGLGRTATSISSLSSPLQGSLPRASDYGAPDPVPVGALAHACPHCPAPAGRPCRTHRGSELASPHDARVQCAREAAS